MAQNEEISPSKVAEIVLENVIDYCDNRYEGSDTSFDCFVDHNPDQFYEFIDLAPFQPELSEEELKAIGNPETFWDEVKKEYEKLWKESLIHNIARFLLIDLKELYETLAVNELHLRNSCRVKRLKAYEKVLNGFKDAIRRALQERKPLTELELLDWFKKMGEAVYGTKNNHYEKEVTYYLNYYDMLDDNDKLEVLSILLNNYIGKLLNKIEQELSELEQDVLINNQ